MLNPFKTEVYPFVDMKVDLALLGSNIIFNYYESLCNLHVTINDILVVKCPFLCTYGDIYQYLCFVEYLKLEIAGEKLTKNQATIELTRYLQTLQYVFESRRLGMHNL